MPNAKRLPSGSYRVQVFSHKENGKNIYESFTAPTRAEAEMKAAEWKNNKKRRIRYDVTVKEAIQGYIHAKSGVLSPSTIRGYDIMARNYYKDIENTPIKKLSSVDLQIFVSTLSQRLSPQTVRSAYALLTSSIGLYLPDVAFRVTLPKLIIKRPISPSDDDIKALFNAARPELKKCIALAAFGSLRRGEICALTYEDIDGNTIHVNKDIVQGKDREWITKSIPKNSQSIRDVSLPQEIIDLLGSGTGKIIKYKTPSSITECFISLRNRLGLSVRFHDLRHYFASIGAVLNIPDTYLADFGGWKKESKNVMKEVYQNKIVSMSEIYSDRMQKHFSELIK